jgi:hypothetical protein
VIGHDYLNLPESIFTYVYKGLKKLDGEITFVVSWLVYTPIHNSWPAVLSTLGRSFRPASGKI